MPRRAAYELRWQPHARAYVLSGDGQSLVPAIRPETPAWWAWLAEASSFAFASAAGATCTLRKETRQRGGAYWCAYKRTGGRMAKRYLGRAEEVTLARLEEAAVALAAQAGAAASKPTTSSHLVGRNAAAAGAALDAHMPAHPQSPAQPARSVPPRAFHPPAPPMRVAGSPAPLLATKLHIPHVATPVIERPHMRQRLRRGLEVPLTLLAAPAGFGKTTALEDWLRSERVPAAWVSLDAGDDDPTQFWTYVLTAMRQVWPRIGAMALTMLQSLHPPSLPAIARTVLNAVAAQRRAVVLVLDDYHLITSPAIHESIAALLEHPPSQLHLYLTARGEPPLPIARFRVNGWVNEISADHLRFRPDEVATFLADVLDVRLSVDDVLALAERTDGWAAGVHLAGLSLQGHPDPAQFIASFGGSHRHVVTYLGEEVLAAQPREIRDFLRHTAILDRLCAPLCDAITSRQDSQSLLERLARANLFLVPLDDEGQWYRYFHLFAELLRHRLRQEDGALLPELHRRAARWLQTEGEVIAAVEHWLAVPDAVAAAEAVEAAAPDMLKPGELPALLALLARLPEEVIGERPALCLAYARALSTRGQGEAAERWITQAERALKRHTSDDARPEHDVQAHRALESEVKNARALLASWNDDVATEGYSGTALGSTHGSVAPAPTAPGALLEPLSARELEVLRLLARGSSNAEIARQLVVAVSTVKTHTHHIYAKLRTSDRLSAVLRARTLGLLEG